MRFMKFVVLCLLPVAAGTALAQEMRSRVRHCT